MPSQTARPQSTERPYLLMFLAALAGLGCISLIAGTVLAQMIVPGHDWVADTISDLGAGELEIVMDVALYGFAAGLFATALAAAHAHLGAAGWSAGVVGLAVLGALVVVIGARNEYGDADSDGVVIHIYLVYALGALFLATPVAMAPGFARDHAWARPTLIALAGLWGITAPVFLMSPDSVDGLIERLLGLIACAIVAVMALIFWRRGRAAG